MKPITIIGGGLAGLTLGILLRRENIPVALVEAGHYPRHRVCGEFLSGRGRKNLRETHLDHLLPDAVEARTCSFHVRNRKPLRFNLVDPALCISRFYLDACLAKEFLALGGVLKTGERADPETREAGVIRANGRRRSTNAGSRLFGLKAHAFDAKCSTDLEMHFGDRQYVGICRLAAGRTNVCGLFFSEHPMAKLHERWPALFSAAVCSDALDKITWDKNSFSSVAALTLDREQPEESFSIGDAAAMTPPLTGNGMSMAIESAFEASLHLRRYCANQIPWSDCVREHARDWRKKFLPRLRWGAFIQRLVFHSSGQRFLFLGARSIPLLPNLFFSKTR